MNAQYRMLDVARWPQEVRVEWERETLDDNDASPLEWVDEKEDAERIAAFRAGDWSFVGIRAKATIYVPIGQGSFATYELTSPGLWAVESDSSEAYFAEVYENEKAELSGHLKLIGAAFA